MLSQNAWGYSAFRILVVGNSARKAIWSRKRRVELCCLTGKLSRGDIMQLEMICGISPALGECSTVTSRLNLQYRD